jgi:PleD family two-component response regulator
MPHILIADDVAPARDALARALRERGHRVTVVADGQEALERYGRERPELAILDVTMPRLDGTEACVRMKALGGPFTPVIMLSARAELDVRLACLAVAEDFVAKPYEAAEMCARVEAHLRTRRLVEEAGARGESESAAQQAPARDPRAAPASTSGLAERAALLERLGEEWRRSARTSHPLSLIVVGVDGSPSGPSGDAWLAFLAAGMQACAHELHQLGRSDESHVAGLLPGVHVTGAMAVADRLRRELRRPGPDGTVPSVSMGIAVFPGRDVVEGADLLRLAERALARAREEGPGRICIYQHQSYLYEPA